MSFIGDAIGGVLGGPLGGVASSLVGGLLQNDSAGDAADQQRYATDQANATQRYFYDTTRADNMPALQSRNWALEQLKAQLSKGLSPQNVQRDPGYQFGMNEGMQALQNQLTARGMRNSGAALKAGTRYAQDYAGTKYNDAFNRQIQALNPLQSMAGLGQSAAGLVGSSAMNAANQIGGNQTALGNALGASSMAQGNALTNALNSAVGWYQNNRAPNNTEVYDYNYRGTELPSVLRGGQ